MNEFFLHSLPVGIWKAVTELEFVVELPCSSVGAARRVSTACDVSGARIGRCLVDVFELVVAFIELLAYEGDQELSAQLVGQHELVLVVAVAAANERGKEYGDQALVDKVVKRQIAQLLKKRWRRAELKLGLAKGM